MASTHHGVVYTKKWVVDLILDVAGYVPGTGISDKVIIEPSCGCGAFLTVIAGRLADDAIAVGKGWTSLGNAIRAYDIDSASIETARKAAVEALMTRGCPAIQARELCEQWIVHGDFILDDVPAADFIVGNPPYVRAVEIDRTKRSLYVKRLSSVTTGCDLYVSFFDRGLDTLKVGGTLCFICADRWLQNKYGTLLRSRMGTDCDLVSLVRMHGVDAFDDEVDAYPAVTTVRKGVAADHLKFVNCAPEFNEADATAVLDWLMDDEPDLVGERFEAFEIDKPTGDRMYPLGNHDLVRFVSQACERLPKLEEAGVKLGIGIATGCDDVFLTEDDDLVESDRMVPIFYMRDHRRGNDDRQRWLVNPWNDDGTLVNLDKYPRLKTYLETNKERLSRRYVAKKNKTAWYRTIDKLTPGLLDRDLLLMPDMAA
ncbi:SAM-dependent methyltransferase, partial [Bifidobacterium longum]